MYIKRCVKSVVVVTGGLLSMCISAAVIQYDDDD